MFKHLGSILSVITISAMVISCQEDISEPNNVTLSINKVETEYEEGAVKLEGYSAEPKIETSLSTGQIEALSTDTKRLAQNYLSNKKQYNPTGRLDFGGYDVGVLSRTGVCPIGTEQIEFFMDCEDNNAKSSDGDPFNNQHGVSQDNNRNLRYRFCRVDGRLFYPFNTYGNVNFSYGLLRLGNYLAPQAIGYSHLLDRSFDNEDNNNKNSTIGDIGPNVSNRYNTVFRILVLQSNISNPYPNGAPGSTKGLPDNALGGQWYGIFAPEYKMSTSISSTSQNWDDYTIFSDDEDNNNANWAKLDGATYTNSFPWLTAGGNTTMKIVYHMF